jgi:hypothetical protein
VSEVKEQITGDEWKVALPLGLVANVSEGKVSFSDKEVKFTIQVEEKGGSRWGNNVTLNKTKSIPASYIKKHDSLVEQLNDLRKEFAEVLVALKSVARKERQVRGKIAMRKLEDSGYASLMADQELMQLVQLDDV